MSYGGFGTLYNTIVGTWTPSYHTEEADTLAHWKFETLIADDVVGTFDLNAGDSELRGPVGDGSKLGLVARTFTYNNTADTALSPNNNADFKYTFATAIYIPALATGNGDIVRYEQAAAGGVHFRVGVTGTADAPNSGRLYVGRDTSAGYQQALSPTAVFAPYFNEWVHFAWTQAADGLSGDIYINGVSVFSWSTANAPNSTDSLARFGLCASWNQVLHGGCYFSPIVREKECSAPEILAMAYQTGVV